MKMFGTQLSLSVGMICLAFVVWSNCYPVENSDLTNAEQPWTELDANDTTVADMVSYYKATLLEKNPSKYITNITAIHSARKKGTYYEASVEVSHWHCEAIAPCRVIKTQDCSFTMLPQNVLHRPATLPHACKEPTFASLAVGDLPDDAKRIETNDTKLSEGIEGTIQHLANFIDPLDKIHIIEILEATVQTIQTTVSTRYRALVNTTLEFYVVQFEKVCYFEMDLSGSTGNFTTIYHDCSSQQHGL
ncbi:hypothetical protein HELRODRAFT_180032 [Helobdella robusta]|uniref:Cystatin domain-containing protein n=1 Tax=Helobdella robusta TaxID=6412 RepID=T1FFD3_HELRO|nr:hypothetical protein HELRODRAFT_180032 [Helobdella robusta]ESN94925.1 hypothetical protein HELRODRAFT_180032 [Helobdella robusta]